MQDPLVLLLWLLLAIVELPAVHCRMLSSVDDRSGAISEWTFPRLRDHIRPHRLLRNPCPQQCSFLEYRLAFGPTRSKMPLRTLVSKYRSAESNSQLCAACRFHSNSSDAALYGHLFPDTLLQAYHRLSTGHTIRHVEPNHKSAAPLPSCWAEPEGFHAGVFIGVDGDGVGNKGWSWNAMMMLSLFLQRPVRIRVSKGQLLGIDSLIGQDPQYPWIAPAENPGNVTEVTVKNKQQLSLLPCEQPMAHKLLQQPREIKTLLASVAVVADTMPPIQSLLSSIAPPPLERSNRWYLRGNTILMNMFWRPTPRLVDRLLHDAKPLLECPSCTLLGVHVRVGIGHERLIDPETEPIEEAIGVITKCLENVRGNFHPVPGFPVQHITYLASDSHVMARRMCAALQSQGRCIHFVASDAPGTDRGHFFRFDNQQGFHLGPEVAESIAYDILRDLFFLSLADALVGSRSTFNALATHWAASGPYICGEIPRWASKQ